MTTAVCASVLLAAPSFASAQDQPQAATASPVAQRPIEHDATVNVPAFRLSPSGYISDAARAAMARSASDFGASLAALVRSGRIPALRAGMRRQAAPAIARLQERYGVDVEETTVGGIHGFWVRPRGSVGRGDRRVLINLPGGAFLVGDAGSEGLKASIPLAGIGRLTILTIDYRQAPEATFPAASQDVAAVYRALLRDRRAGDIGIYGCSAGGLLTAQALAWFQRERLPAPGAAGILCAGADARWGGDSFQWQQAMHGLTSPPTIWEMPYYGTHDLDDPLMSPMRSDAVLRAFPPTLVITATRAGELSSAVDTHRRLVRNGVDAQLYVWDGLDHAFFTETDTPETREAFDVMARFFNAHLPHRRR